MEKYGIIPDVIPIGPTEVLKVTFTNNVEVNLGNELTPTQVTDQPTVTWTVNDPNSLYTIIFITPDYTSQEDPIHREFQFCQWIIGNIPGNEVAKGEVLKAYIGSCPPRNTGLHRYVFLLYKQTKRLLFEGEHRVGFSPLHRVKFSVQKFAEKYNFDDPIAGNFFQAQYDDYVLILRNDLMKSLSCSDKFNICLNAVFCCKCGL